jgi:hypothetical protein
MCTFSFLGDFFASPFARETIYLTHCATVREFLHGYAGETITLAALMKEFHVQELVTFSRQLAYCASTFSGSGKIDPEVRDALRIAFVNACPALVNIGLKNTLILSGDFFQRTLREELSDDQFSEAANQLFKTLQNETFGVICFKTDTTYTKIIDGDDPMPHHIRDRFPQAVAELEEAAKCVLYERGTACVFHSMRAVEVVLKASWKILGLPAPQKADSWGNLFKPIDDQLAANPKNAHPLWQANRQFLAELVADVRAAKQAYRDPTMHVESNYTLAEARAIFNATKTLIGHAAKQLDQDGNFLPLT